MKRLISIALLAFGLMTYCPVKAMTACEYNTNSFGEVTLSLPVLPTTGNYNVWTRMQAPDNTNSYYALQVNGDSCLNVGGNVQTGTWQWVNTQVDNNGAKVSYDFAKTSGNTVKLIGVKPGVKIDRLLLVKNDCTPVDLGANCVSETNVLAVDNGAKEIPPISTTSVSGKIIPTPTITENIDNISSVNYYVNSSAVSAGSDFTLDTTLIDNGQQRITIHILKKDGTVIDEATTLTVGNSENGFTSIWRWARLNRNALLGAGFSIIVGVVGLISWTNLKKARLKKRNLKFRGF